MSKWPGVSGSRSLLSFVIAHIGLEFIHASIWHRSVLISSNVSFIDVLILRKWCFVNLTYDFHWPPQFGELGGMKWNSIPSFANVFAISIETLDCA